MLEDVLVPVLVSALVGFVGAVIDSLMERWGRQKLPKNVCAEMSETDKAQVDATKDLMRQCFGEDVVECIKNASNKDRIAMMAEFAERLARQYGLDIEVDVTVSNLENCGAYNWKDRKAVFNIAMLMVDGQNKQFDYCVRETLDTIIHGLRHAVQHKAVEQPGFWNVEEERRKSWAVNMAPGNYISPKANIRAYARQPIEKDAVSFAAMVMGEVASK